MQPDAVWTIDFIREHAYRGKVSRTLNAIAQGNRSALGFDVPFSIPAGRVITFHQASAQKLIEQGRSVLLGPPPLRACNAQQKPNQRRTFRQQRLGLTEISHPCRQVQRFVATRM
jgi:hypothetical protein